MREEFLELLRADGTLREEIRRQLLTEELLNLPGKFDRLTEQVGETTAAVRDLAIAQQRTEAALQDTQKVIQELVNWQRGEVGRRKGERYERETIRSAPALFDGGQGGAPDQPWVQQRLTEWLKPLFGDAPFLREDDPFLADLVWWKGERIAVVEISHQVNGYEVSRAARRAETLGRAGAQALAVVIGREWASAESRLEARLQNVEWKVGSDLSEGFLTFRRRLSE